MTYQEMQKAEEALQAATVATKKQRGATKAQLAHTPQMLICATARS